MANHAYLVILSQPITTDRLGVMIVEAHEVFCQEEEGFEQLKAKVEYIGQTLIKTGV